MTTPIYGLPVPTLATIADGPDGFLDLALRVERQMTTLRAVNNYGREQGTNVAWGVDIPVHSVTTPLSVIGWVEVEVEVFLGGLNPADSLWAGLAHLTCNGTRLRAVRFHNQGLTRALGITFTGAMNITAAMTSLTTVLSILSDPTGNFIYHRSHISVRQYGAPSTG